MCVDRFAEMCRRGAVLDAATRLPRQRASKACLWAVVALLWLGAATTGRAQPATPQATPRTITVVSDDNYPPFIFRDSQGRLQGVLKDSWALWSERTGIQVDLQAMDWAKAQQTMLAGQADVIDTIFKTESRKPLYDFTAPYATLEVAIYFHQSVSGSVNADSVKAFAIGVKEGDACIEALRERGVDTLKQYPSYSAVVAAAAAGELHVFCMDRPPAMYLLNQLGLTKAFRELPPLFSGQFHRAVRKGDAATLALVEDGFRRITAAERSAIDRQWFGAELQAYSAVPYARYGGYALLAALLAAALLAIWSFSLRRRVTAKTAELSHSVAALTQAKQASELALAQLDATLEAIPDLLFELDSEGRHLDYRAARSDLLVSPPKDLLGRTVGEVMPREAADIVMAALRTASARGSAYGAQIRLNLPEGRHWFEISVARKRGAPGQGERFIVLSRDINDRKLAEIALKQSERSFRHFFEAGLVGMAITVPDKRWGHFNQRLAEMLSYTPSELADLTWQELTHPDDVAADVANFNRVMAGELDAYTMDKRFIRKDGSVMDAAIAVRCERDPTGRAERFFAIIEDIGQRKAAEKALARHRDELEQLVQARSQELIVARDVAEAASRAKSEFLSRMSHELRTPMNAIMGFSQLLEFDTTLTPRSRQFVQETLRAGKHLLDLINDVLDLAQVESGRIALAPEPLPMAAIATDVLTLLAPLAAQCRVTLHAGEFDRLVVRADRTRLKQVLVNLVSNAIKYNRAGGSVNLLAAALDTHTLRITVRDTGVGITPQRLSQVFEPFNRLGAEYGSIEGTGIGLSICRRLVELMDGQIGVTSTRGEGSEFWIDLPRDSHAELARTQVATNPPLEPAAPPLRRATLLYVEDNAANLQLMEHVVERHPGLQLLSATAAAPGLALAREHRPDLLLLDINLPDMDGYALLSALRADPRTRDIPAVAITANAMPSDALRARTAGFDEYLSKPIDLTVFEAMLARLLDAGPPGR